MYLMECKWNGECNSGSYRNEKALKLLLNL